MKSNSTMRPSAALTILTLALVMLTAAAAGANCIVPLSQARSVDGSAFVENYYIGEQDSDSAGDAAADFGPFDSAQSGTAQLDYGYASGGGWQESAIGSSRITARGSQFANAESYDWDTWAEASGRSLFDVTFEVSEALDAQLIGSVAAYDSGYCSVVLTGPGGIVFSEYGDGYYGEVYFDEAIALGPGTWRLEARATGSVYSDYSYYGYSFAEYDVTLAVCPLEVSLTCVPGSGTLPFVSNFTASIANYESTRAASLVAARINVALAGGTSYTNWKAGSAVIPSGSVFTTVWNQDIPLLGTLVGSNVFTMEAEDVSPAPYNQPPYSPSGFGATDTCTLVGLAE